MQKGLISVVLSIYNVEKYLERCLNSIVNQTYRNLEIILIDDGSPDRCPQICEEWAKKDERIKVVHKKNAGLGMARNTGIENATGEYICFFDSDDYITLDALEKCYQLLQKESAEIVCFGLSNVNRAGNVTSSLIPRVSKKIYAGEEVLQSFLPELIAPDPSVGGNPNFRMSAWSAMYSMRVIQKNNWRFVSERTIIAEDVYSLLILYKDVDKVVVLPEALYCYCENDTSLTRSYRKDRYEKIKLFYEESVKLCEQFKYSADIVHRLSKPYLAFTIAALKQEVAVERPHNQSRASIKEIIDDEVLQRVLKANKKDRVSITRTALFWTIRYKWYGLCFRLLKAKT